MYQPHGFPQRTCRACHSLTIHWIWRLVEPQPHLYEILCSQCATQQDASFTAETAIAEAMAVITARHHICDSREMMACPPPFRVWYPLIGGVL